MARNAGDALDIEDALGGNAATPVLPTVPSRDRNTSLAGYVLRQTLGGFSPNPDRRCHSSIFHIGNQLSSVFDCRCGNFVRCTAKGYALAMIERIGARRPVRLYIEEWMAKVPGLDRKRLAERMGVSPGTITKKLQVPKKIDAEWAAKFADGLGLDDPTDIFRDPDAPTPASLLKGMTDEQTRELVTYADFLRKRSA